MSHYIKQLPWKLIIILGLIGLIRPVAKIIGDIVGYSIPPIGTYALTAAIAILWIAAVVKLKVKQPIHTLACVGAVYAMGSIAMAVIIQLSIPALSDSEANIPVLLTVGLIASTLFNMVYGALLGVIASILQKSRK